MKIEIQVIKNLNAAKSSGKRKIYSIKFVLKIYIRIQKNNKITTKTSSSGNQRKKTNVSLKQAEEIKILK